MYYCQALLEGGGVGGTQGNSCWGFAARFLTLFHAISDQKMSFCTSVFRPEGGHKTNIHVYKYRNYIIITEIRTPTKDFSS